MSNRTVGSVAPELEGGLIVCYAPNMITTMGVWQGDNPLDYSLPLFILQLTLVTTITRILVFILNPLRQPRVISEILAGVILGPSVLGVLHPNAAKMLFPLRSVMVLETMANIGLLYFLFLVGVELDLGTIKRTGRKAIGIALGGMILPFIIGCVFSIMLQNNQNVNSDRHNSTYVLLFLGVALAVTAFPVLARILTELKLINSEIGRLAMSAALVNDIFAWVMLAIAIALTETVRSSVTPILILLTGAAYIAFCIFVIRPAMKWIIRRTPEGEPFSDFYICIILAGVMISGFITDAIGTHSVFGAFLFGLIIPNGPLSVTLIEKLDDFVSGLLLPLFFAISGLRTDITQVQGGGTWISLIFVILLACTTKVAGTTVVSYFYNVPIRDGITLGLFMNTKGLVEMVILNVGKDQKVLDDESFAIMVISSVIMTSLVGPLVTTFYRPARRHISYKRRTIQRTKLDSEFRVVTCIHTPRNVPTIINLLEASLPTKRSPIYAYALHLVELTGRASSMLIVHDTIKSERAGQNRTQAQSEQIISAFENFEQNNANVIVQSLTAISPYSSMHEDVCNLAEDKRASFIIIPFHKQQTIAGGMESTNPALRTINQNILANAPCSVGILIDRGLIASNRNTSQGSQKVRDGPNIVVLFFGGPDDREALAYAWRMAHTPTTRLTLLRFMPTDDAYKAPVIDQSTDPNEPKMLTVMTDIEHERQLDNDCITNFRTKTVDDGSITYSEITLRSWDETMEAIRSIETVYDLYMVGRGQGMVSPLTAGLAEWSECPELGAIGDMLASSDFAAKASVLVMQQYIGAAGMPQNDGTATPDSPAGQIDIDEQLTKGIQQINQRQIAAKGQDVF